MARPIEKRRETKRAASAHRGPCKVCGREDKPEKPPSPTWARIAKNNIMHRSHSEMSEIWRRQGGDQDEVSLQELVNSVFTITDFDLTKSTEIKSLPGSLLSASVELRRLYDKALAASTAAGVLYEGGRPTWSSVDAYHASFLTAKAILAVFGIFIVTLSGANFFLDLVPGEGDKEFRKDFARQNKELEFPVRFMTIGGSRLEHRHVWELLRRISSKCTVEPLDEKEAHWFRSFDFTRYSSLRNRVIYASFFWSSYPDLLSPISNIEPLSGHHLLSSFHENIWMEDEMRDHILMSILGRFATKLYPFAPKSRDGIKHSS